MTSPSRDVESDDAAVTVLVGTTTREGELDASRVAEGTRLGRFVVLEEVGAGGMGRVLRAYDPKLRREVALKLMRAPDAIATERMLREAQAMAQLSHPNVVPVYDVGEHERGLFIAMELVEGKTLRQWCKDDRPGWRDVVRVFRDAGCGLAAAHRAGLVHRDFKPDNVLVDGTGRVRVMDFGLARAADEEPVQELGSQGSLTTSGTGPLPNALTEHGTVLGTPAYMAPEQHRGVAGDRRSDQFAYCVALYEALHGQRPFTGDTLVALARAKARGTLRPLPPNTAAVPKWLDRVVMRGLSPEPTQRWPSVEALIAELDRDVGRTWRRRGLALVVLVGVPSIAVAVVRHRAALCTGASAQLADLWDSRRSEALESAFLQTGVSHAAETWTRVRSGLDAYAMRWTKAHTEACEATRKRGEQSQQIMDARMRCLQARRRELSALVDTLARSDADVLHKAVEAVTALPSVERCDDIDYVLAQVPPPDDPGIESRVDALRERLAQARALHSAGQYGEGLVIAQAVADEAHALGYMPLVAEALRRRGALETGTGAYEDALGSLRQAYFDARRSGMDELGAEAASALVFLLGHLLNRHDDALAWAEHAQAEVDRLGDDDMHSTLLNHIAVVHFHRGSYDEATALHQRALALQERSLGPDNFEAGTSLTGLANVLHARGSSDEAIPLFEQALALREQALGPEHPDIAVALSNLGIVHRARGDYAESIRLNERSLAIRERVLGSEHPEVAVSLSNLAAAHFSAGDYDPALSLFERALTIRENAFGSDHPKVAEMLNNLAAAHAVLGSTDASAAMHERALVIWEATHGPEHPLVATSLNNLGNVARERGSHDDAVRLYARARGIWERTLGPEHPNVVLPLIGTGEIALVRGHADEAVPLLERALQIREARHPVPADMAEARFALARALWDAPPSAGRDRPRARTLAHQARETYRDIDRAEPLSEVEAWLATRAR